MNHFDVFFEISHKSRYEILQMLLTARAKHSDIEKKLNLKGAEVSRHLKRLQNLKLIDKTANGDYEISTFGRIICSVVPKIEHCVPFVDFINSHNFSQIYSDQIIRLLTIPQVELKESTMENIGLWVDLINKAEKFVYCSTDQIIPDMIPNFVSKFTTTPEFSMKAIIGKKLLSEFKLPKNPNYNSEKLMKMINFFDNVRMDADQDIALIVTEKAAMMFLKSQKSIDYSQAIFSKHQEFIRIVKDLFEEQWNNANTINRNFNKK